MTKLLLVLLIFCVPADLKEPYKGLKGVPVPKADDLDELLSKFMGKSDYTGAVFNYLKGQSPNSQEDNLDIAVLDVDNVRKLINKAKNKYEHVYRRKSEAYQINRPESQYIINTALDMMKQSIYATRYRLEDTKRYRKKFANSATFNIAIFYGALMQVNLKIEALYSSMRMLNYDTHFLWYLIIYEKILAATVDAHDMVDRIFYLHGLYQKNLIDGQGFEIAPTIPLPSSTTRRPRRSRTRTTTTQRRRPAEVPPDDSEEGGSSGKFSKVPGFPPQEEHDETTPKKKERDPADEHVSVEEHDPPAEHGPSGGHGPPGELTPPPLSTLAPPENTEAVDKNDEVSDLPVETSPHEVPQESLGGDEPKVADVSEGKAEIPAATPGEPADPAANT